MLKLLVNNNITHAWKEPNNVAISLGKWVRLGRKRELRDFNVQPHRHYNKLGQESCDVFIRVRRSHFRDDGRVTQCRVGLRGCARAYKSKKWSLIPFRLAARTNKPLAAVRRKYFCNESENCRRSPRLLVLVCAPPRGMNRKTLRG
jgi:hypothetical protein